MEFRFFKLTGFKCCFGRNNSNPDDLKEPELAYYIKHIDIWNIEIAVCRINGEWRAFHFGTGLEVMSPKQDYPSHSRNKCFEQVINMFNDMGKEQILEAIKLHNVIQESKEVLP